MCGMPYSVRDMVTSYRAAEVLPPLLRGGPPATAGTPVTARATAVRVSARRRAMPDDFAAVAASPASGETAQRPTAVVDEHVAERGEDVDRRAALGAAQLEHGPVEVADDPLAVVQLAELPQVGVAGSVQRRQAGIQRADGDVAHEE